MQAREDVDRAGAAVTLGAGILLPVLLVLRPPPPGVPGAAAGWCVVVLLLDLGSIAVVAPRRLPRRTWPVVAVCGAVGVAALRPAFPDTPGLAYAVLTALVLFATGFLDRTTGRVVTGIAAAAALVVSATSFGPTLAVLHAGAVCGGLVLLQMLLARFRAEQGRVLAALREQATVDAVTGLVSRTAFRPTAHALVAEAASSGRVVALLLVDVDDFKRVNDVHGHPVGDAALLHLAGVLRSGVREDDAVVARLGGDELALLLPGCGREAAVARADELLEVVRRHPLALPGGGELTLRFSVGVALAPEHGRTFPDLYEAADGALYAAKRAGRDRAALAT